MILVSNIFVDVCILVIKVQIFRIISLSIVQENRKSMIELQTSVKTSKQDDTTRTRTPKPGYLKLTIKKLPSLWDCLPKYSEVPLFGVPEKVAETNSFDSRLRHLNA
jgi:hypothetical protein